MVLLAFGVFCDGVDECHGLDEVVELVGSLDFAVHLGPGRELGERILNFGFGEFDHDGPPSTVAAWRPMGV